MKERKPFLISNPIFLFANFLVESHYLDHLSFKQIFFCKIKQLFFYFQHHHFFNTFLFQTCHFFTTFRLTFKNIFSKKTNTTLIFSIFFIQHSKIYIFWRKWTRHSLSIFSIFYCKQNIILFFLQRNKIKNFIFLYFLNSKVQISKNQFLKFKHVVKFIDAKESKNFYFF